MAAAAVLLIGSSYMFNTLRRARKLLHLDIIIHIAFSANLSLSYFLSFIIVKKT